MQDSQQVKGFLVHVQCGAFSFVRHTSGRQSGTLTTRLLRPCQRHPWKKLPRQNRNRSPFLRFSYHLPSISPAITLRRQFTLPIFTICFDQWRNQKWRVQRHHLENRKSSHQRAYFYAHWCIWIHVVVVPVTHISMQTEAFHLLQVIFY